MKQRLGGYWDWLAAPENRGRVTTLATLGLLLVSLVSLVSLWFNNRPVPAPAPPLGAEVTLPVDEYQGTQIKGDQEVGDRFSRVHGSEDTPLTKAERVLWNLSTEQERISQATGEADLQHFEQELRSLYPRLQEIGLETPLLEPVRTGNQEYDWTWHGFHLAFLKTLRRQIRDENFDLEQWNSDVIRENEKRRNWLHVYTN